MNYLLTLLSTGNELWHSLATNCHVLKIKPLKNMMVSEIKFASFHTASALTKDRAKTTYRPVPMRAH